ncbi:organic cation/carnitine transporter 7 [Artemisia annua]|uniref:Organic cation/carnitine transporter 7 n=1 Tax=Artemisia annua TaxID=35608 RepID=A0A2U1P8S1_ARTAN|nr:organic cation/carnitine transporter 7 [Artemisia annua]
MAEQGPAGYTVDQALEAIGYGKFHAKVFLYVMLGSVGEAMELMLLTYVGLATKADFKLTSSEENLISIVTYIGIIFGAWLWSAVSDSFGRKPGFLGAAIVTSVAGCLSCLAHNYMTLMVFRGIVGFGLGGAHVFTTWGMEFVPRFKTGILTIALFACCSIGTCLEALLAWLIVPTFGWRVLFGVSSLPSLLVLVFYKFVPESPIYLYSKGKLEDAIKVLMEGATLNGKALPEGSLIPENIPVAATATNESSLTEPLITDISSSGGDETSEERGENNAQQAQPGRLSAMLHLLTTWIRTTVIRWIKTKFFPCIKSSFLRIKMLLSATWYRKTILLWLLYFMNTYSYSGIIHLTSELNSQDITDRGFYKNVFVISFAEFPGLCLAAWTMQNLGRKLAMVNMLFMGFLLFLVQTIDQCQTIMTSVFATRMVMSGCFVAIQMYTEEVYPTPLRTTAVGIAIIVGRIGSIVWPLAPAATGADDTRKTPAMIMFTLKIFVSFVSVLMLPVETRLEELEDP